MVPGTAGTYEVDITAAGYQTVHRTVHVAGSTPACGCPIVNTEHIAVTLTPTS
jgi:hypothetical protein